MNLPKMRLKEDRRGVIWVGFSDLFPPSSTLPKGVCYGDGENFAVLDLGEGLDTLVIHEDDGGHLWFGGFQGLRCYDGRTTRKIGLEEGFSGIMVSAIAEDEKGRLFFGHCDSTGSEVRLTRYDGQHFATLFSEERKDAFFSINAIIASRSGDLWFALGGWKGQGVGKGIGRVDDAGRITFYTVEDGLVDSRVEDLVEDRHHRLWVATWGGISCFDGAKFQNFTTEEGLPNNHVQCICEDRQGHLWFGTEGGAVHYDGRLFQYIRSPEIIYVNKIIEDRTGRLWFATLNGVVRYTLSCTPPRVRVLQVITDQVYQAVELVSSSEGEVVLKVEGAIAGQGVGVLAKAGRAWLQPGRRVVLDLAGVDFIDPAGLALLQDWSGQGVVTRAASLYVRYLLQSQGLMPGPDRPKDPDP